MPPHTIEDAKLDETISLQEKAVRLAHDNYPEKPRQLYDLAVLLQRRYQLFGTVDDINNAILLQQQAASLILRGSPDEPHVLCGLGSAYHIRFQGLGDLSDLESAIELQTKAVSSTPVFHLDRAGRLGELGMAHHSRFKRVGSSLDLYTAYTCQNQAASSTPDYHPNKHHQLGNLGVVCLSKYQLSGYADDLDKAVTYLERSLSLVPEAHPDKPAHLENLGLSYLSRFSGSGELSDLGVAVDFQSQAVSLTPDRHICKSSRLLRLGNSYHTQFQRTRNPSDLQSAISCQTRSISLTPDGHPDKPQQLESLGRSYYSQFQHLVQQIDIDLAIDFQFQSMSQTPNTHPDRPRRLGSLGNFYYARYRYFEGLSDLDSAISYQTEAILLMPNDHSDKSDCLIDLGMSRCSRFQRLGQLSDLRIATDCHSQVTQIVFDNHPNGEDRLSRLTNLRNMIQTGLGQPQTVSRTLDDRGHEISYSGTSYNRRGDTPAPASIVPQQPSAISSSMASFSNFPISSGGFGDIYRGKIQGGTEIAVKTMRLREVDSNQQNQKSLKHAARELYAWSKFQHRNVQRLLGLVEFRGQIGMVSAWEANGSLPTYLERHPEVDRCQLSAQISDGLSYLHGSNICNVLVSEDGIPLLTDFGNATIQKHTLSFTDTSTNTAMSLRWAAPELLSGTTTFSKPADVYALGMETVTGNIPYLGKAEMAVVPIVLIQKGHPERPHQHIPLDSMHGEALWTLLKRCWIYEPEDRPSAPEVKQISGRFTIKRSADGRYYTKGFVCEW
ncbi:hypothetical protein FRC07_008021 [Ceratobasidium sp. 392]|nr:hypothetical protein FRC07_008021 [Ceratobasidium sp. 392]